MTHAIHLVFLRLSLSPTAANGIDAERNLQLLVDQPGCRRAIVEKQRKGKW